MPRAYFHQGNNYLSLLNKIVPISINPCPRPHYVYWEDKQKTWKGLTWITLSALNWVANPIYNANEENLRISYMRYREFGRYSISNPSQIINKNESGLFMPNSNDCILGLNLPFLSEIDDFNVNDAILLKKRVNRIKNIIDNFNFRAVIFYSTNNKFQSIINSMLGINYKKITPILKAGREVKTANYINKKGDKIKCLNILNPVSGQGFGREYAFEIGKMI